MNAHDPHGENTTKKATVNGLAVVGFIALIIGGMLLVIYAAKYIPETLERLAGAVYLSPDETVNPEEEPSVVIPEDEESETPTAPATSTPSIFDRPALPQGPSVGGPTYYPPVTYPTPVPQQYYGNPDLTVDILAVGYLRTSSASSFVPDTSIDEDDRPALRFRVTNVGTNAISSWQVEVQYPAASGPDRYLITSRDLLLPGGYKDFTFGFDDPEEGDDRRFTVIADPRDVVREGNESNNVDRATIDIGRGRGSSRDISCDLEVSPSRIDEGDRATLRWDTSGDVDYASINQGIGRVDEDGGSERVSPRRDTTYRLTVRGDGDQVTCSVTLRVDED